MVPLSSNGHGKGAQPLSLVSSQTERDERRAWSLFGHLVANSLLALPDFDNPDHEQVCARAMAVHGQVCTLAEWLQRPENG